MIWGSGRPVTCPRLLVVVGGRIICLFRLSLYCFSPSLATFTNRRDNKQWGKIWVSVGLCLPHNWCDDRVSICLLDYL